MSSDSSDDDRPLARPNGHGSASKSALDRSASKNVTNGLVNGDKMDIDSPSTNGNKRKSRSSISQPNYEEGSDSDDAQPLAKRKKPNTKVEDSDSDDEPINKSRANKLSAKQATLPTLESSDDDAPLGAKLAKKKAVVNRNGKESKPKTAVKDESDDEKPLAKSAVKRLSTGAPSTKRKSNGVKKEDSDSDAPISKRSKAAPAKKGKSAATSSKDIKKDKSKEVTEEPEDEYEWWNEPKREDDSIKWETLEHNGVLFAPEYEPLPKHVKLMYDGNPVTLGVEAEEVALFWVAMMTGGGIQHTKDPVFRSNFFEDFSEYVKKYGATDAQGNKVDIKSLDKCNFDKMFEYWFEKTERTKNKNLPKAEKEAAKKRKEELEAPYTHCLWNGRKEKVGNFRVEPPGLFRGRGDHPLKGKVKKRVLPEQVTINIGKDAKIPEPPKGHKWKHVQHDQKATWLAMWQENINGNYKYVMLAASSAIKGQSDYKKFEKARELKKYVDKIRKDYTKDLVSEQMADRQRATAMYLIDHLALRAGNEKDTEKEAETVGCCSLKYEHITLEPPNKVTFDFLGKDSIRYFETCEVTPRVFKNLKLFKKPPKTVGDNIFDRLTTSQLNKHLNSYMPGLTAKVFRTYNASYTMARLLNNLENDPRSRGSIQEKIKLYNDCNREVAILCNHKRAVNASHDQQMQKLGDRIKGLKYQKWRTKQMILAIEPTQKKKKGASWFELDDDLDEAWIMDHQEFLLEQEKTRITKKFEKENEKLEANKEKPMPEKELKERLKAVKELDAKFKKENKTKKVEPEGKGPTVEKYMKAIERLDERVKVLETQAEDRDGNKEVALSTSKINYIDPRLTVVFSKKFDIPIERLLNKTLREKFQWAISLLKDVDDWTF